MGQDANGTGAAATPEPGGPARIKPAPVPTSVGVVAIPDAKVVALVITTPVGSAWYFISADAARQTAANLVTMADQASSGLVVPRSPDLAT